MQINIMKIKMWIKNMVDKIPPVFINKSDVLSNNMANVSGTSDDSKIAVLNLDGTEIPINSNGKFSVEIYIPPRTNLN